MKHKLWLIGLFSLLIMGKLSAAPLELECVNYFSKLEKPTAQSQLEIYTKVGECLKYLPTNRILLKNIVNTYRLIFQVNPSHFHLESFIPFYIENQLIVDETVRDVVLDETERQEFFLRLTTAKREFIEGNG